MTSAFFTLVLRKFSEITNTKPIFSQYNTFYKYKIFFFNLQFDCFSIITKKVNQIRNNAYSLCCSSPYFRVLLCTHYGLLQCFSTYFRKLKKKSEFYYDPHFQTMLFFVTMFRGCSKVNLKIYDVISCLNKNLITHFV